MYQSLSSLVPNAADLLALEVEELAGVLLTHLNSYEGQPDSSIYQRGDINRHNFFNALGTTSGPRGSQEYGDGQPEVNKAVMEAWAWLQSEGFLVKKAPSAGDTFFISRRAQRLKSRDDFEAYRKASLLPKGQLHPFTEKKGQAVTPGPLTDTQLPAAEQEAMANLFAGAIGLYKNPQSHRHVPTHPEDAAEVIVFASQLLRIVDRLKPSPGAQP
jgi:hypothetical protein